MFYLICFVSLQMSTLTCLHLSKGHHAVWADVALAVVQIRPKQALSTKLAIKNTTKTLYFCDTFSSFDKLLCNNA